MHEPRLLCVCYRRRRSPVGFAADAPEHPHLTQPHQDPLSPGRWVVHRMEDVWLLALPGGAGRLIDAAGAARRGDARAPAAGGVAGRSTLSLDWVSDPEELRLAVLVGFGAAWVSARYLGGRTIDVLPFLGSVVGRRRARVLGACLRPEESEITPLPDPASLVQSSSGRQPDGPGSFVFVTSANGLDDGLRIIDIDGRYAGITLGGDRHELLGEILSWFALGGKMQRPQDLAPFLEVVDRQRAQLRRHTDKLGTEAERSGGVVLATGPGWVAGIIPTIDGVERLADAAYEDRHSGWCSSIGASHLDAWRLDRSWQQATRGVAVARLLAGLRRRDLTVVVAPELSEEVRLALARSRHWSDPSVGPLASLVHSDATVASWLEG